MYYAAAWAWLELLTRGPAEAEQAMSTSLKAANARTEQADACPTRGVSATGSAESLYGGATSSEWIDEQIQEFDAVTDYW